MPGLVMSLHFQKGSRVSRHPTWEGQGKTSQTSEAFVWNSELPHLWKDSQLSSSRLPACSPRPPFSEHWKHTGSTTSNARQRGRESTGPKPSQSYLIIYIKSHQQRGGCLPSHCSHLGLLKLGLGNVTSISWAAWHAVYHPTVHRAARNKELYKPKSQQYLAEKP